MWYVIGGLVVIVLAIIGGSLIWRKHGTRIESGAKTVKDTVGKI